MSKETLIKKYGYFLPYYEVLVVYSEEQLPLFDNFSEAAYLKEIRRIIAEIDPDKEVSFLVGDLLNDFEIYGLEDEQTNDAFEAIAAIDVSDSKYYKKV